MVSPAHPRLSSCHTRALPEQDDAAARDRSTRHGGRWPGAAVPRDDRGPAPVGYGTHDTVAALVEVDLHAVGILDGVVLAGQTTLPVKTTSPSLPKRSILSASTVTGCVRSSLVCFRPGTRLGRPGQRWAAATIGSVRSTRAPARAASRLIATLMKVARTRPAHRRGSRRPSSCRRRCPGSPSRRGRA